LKRLIRQAQSGSTEAREQLVTALSPRVAGIVRYYSSCCDEEYDDLLSEGWCAVFQALEETRPEVGEPEHFLLKCARWRILDYIKWARRRRATTPHPVGQVADAADVAGNVIHEVLVAQLLPKLSGTQRVVFRALLQGRTWREIAAHLGCSSANVAYHVRHIRRRCEGMIGNAAEGQDACTSE